jgi:5-methyltetrahydrofolate--homocysteine methyltransferase
MKPSVSSLYQAVEIRQDIPPLLIGERCNTNGSRQFREMLLADDFEGCLQVALDQEAKGAQILDICTAYAGRDEKADLVLFFNMLIRSVKIPLMVDSTQKDCIEAVLKIYPGRCIINSINLEDGGKNLNYVCTLAKKYGAAVIALTIHKTGMAMTTAEKVQTAQQIYDLAVGEHGLRPQDILFDPLTFTIGSGDETLRDAAIQTLQAIAQIKRQMPGVHTLLGVSNISFGLRPAARKILNSVFLHEAVQAGLDAAIIDTSKVIPLAQIDQQDRDICFDLIYNRQNDPEKTPLMAFIDYFEAKGSDEKKEEAQQQEKAAEKTLGQMILKGKKDGLEDILSILMQRYKPLDIINTVLVPAMRYVGELFGKGEILLPFVLQSAEVMKKSVAFLEPFMDKTQQGHQLKVLLATVQGDVHDIGKNLVDIILTNNGYKVYNLGIKVPAETIIEKAKEYNVDIVGLSGLLVKSAIVMQESMPQYKQAGLKCPILLGGAALTKKFVAQSCVPQFDRPVVYCPDAFAGLKAVRDFEQGKLTATQFEQKTFTDAPKPGLKHIEVDTANPVPAAPFLGRKIVMDIDPAVIYPYVNEQALFRGRWGYRRGNTSVQEYEQLIGQTVIPIYEQLKLRGITEKLIEPKVTYGYFKCFSRENSVFVLDGEQSYKFQFPRQAFAPNLCIADFFKPESPGDIAGFFVVTIGEKIGRVAKELFEKDAYHDYLMLHGFGVEVTDALAEYWHEVMRIELGISQQRPADITGFVSQQYQGSRYGFGYPACPDLGAHEHVFKLLRPEEIGVTLTENMEMVPEQTTSAIIAHHPQAKYFAV